MIKRKHLISVFLVAINSIAYGQDSKKIGMALETDPFSTMFGAKTLSIIVEPSKIEHWSLFANVVSADFPNWMDDFLNSHNKGKGFNTKIAIGGGLAVDYFWKDQKEGTYIGLINLFFNNEVSKNNVKSKIITHNIIPRIGYRWYPLQQKGFYINPFIGIRYEYSIEGTLWIEEKKFEPAGIQPFATMHVGYYF